jgi:hypothetical protein
MGKALGFKLIMTVVLMAFNFIWSRGLNHSFKAFFDEIESEYGDTDLAKIRFWQVFSYC